MSDKMSGRDELVKYILDNSHSPTAILGAAVSFVRVNSLGGRRIADAVDDAIKREIESMKSEGSITPGDVLNTIRPRT